MFKCIGYHRATTDTFEMFDQTRAFTIIHSFIHLVVCLTSGPKPLPNRALHILRTRASSFKCEYPLLSVRPSSSSLRFLPHLPITSIPLSFLQ